jgi:hypothetical protein
MIPFGKVNCTSQKAPELLAIGSLSLYPGQEMLLDWDIWRK